MLRSLSAQECSIAFYRHQADTFYFLSLSTYNESRKDALNNALEMQKAAFNLSHALDDLINIARYLCLRAEKMLEKADYKTLLEDYRVHVELVKQIYINIDQFSLQDKRNLAMYHEQLAIAYYDQYEQQIMHYQTAINILIDSEDPKDQQKNALRYFHMATLHRKYGKTEQAKAAIQDSLALSGPLVAQFKKEGKIAEDAFTSQPGAAISTPTSVPPVAPKSSLKPIRHKVKKPAISKATASVAATLIALHNTDTKNIHPGTVPPAVIPATPVSKLITESIENTTLSPNGKKAARCLLKFTLYKNLRRSARRAILECADGKKVKTSSAKRKKCSTEASDAQLLTSMASMAVMAR